jgi:hypothetical protein
MKTTREQHEHVKIQANATAQSVRLQGKNATFRKLYIYAAKDYAVRGSLTANDNDMSFGFDGDGPLVLTESILAGDLTARFYQVPDGLAEMKIEDLWISGTAGDGVWISWITDHPV